jgi:hypothetical protein
VRVPSTEELERTKDGFELEEKMLDITIPDAPRIVRKDPGKVTKNQSLAERLRLTNKENRYNHVFSTDPIQDVAEGRYEDWKLKVSPWVAKLHNEVCDRLLEQDGQKITGEFDRLKREKRLPEAMDIYHFLDLIVKPIFAPSSQADLFDASDLLFAKLNIDNLLKNREKTKKEGRAWRYADYFDSRKDGIVSIDIASSCLTKKHSNGANLADIVISPTKGTERGDLNRLRERQSAASYESGNQEALVREHAKRIVDLWPIIGPLGESIRAPVKNLIAATKSRLAGAMEKADEKDLRDYRRRGIGGAYSMGR